MLDPEALTIGFARRFASYKRGTLIFRDIARLKQLLTAKNMPVQIIIAGKAHPNDNIGKEMIKHIVHMGRDIDMRHRIVFLEDYDMNVAHYLVQGTDIWLNNPRRPLEASGTSGMKAAANGVLNVSVLDGWWCEGYNGKNGWVIGSGEEYDNPDYQDEVESKALYDILEKDIVPLFYHRGHDGLSREWIAKMKLSMQTNCPAFNTNRMIEEYTRKFYNPADFKYEALVRNNYEAAKKLAKWKKFMEDSWVNVKINSVEDNISGDINLGNTFTVRAGITLGAIKPDDVSVQIYWGYMDSKHRITMPNVHRMKQVEQKTGGNYLYEGTITGDRVGHCGYIVRILPRYDGDSLVMPELITWQSA